MIGSQRASRPDGRRAGWTWRAAALFVCIALQAPAAQAASYATAYDMDRFLNQPNPFDLPQAQPAPTEPSTPVSGAATDGEADGEPLFEEGDAGPAATVAEGQNDPLEPMNRLFFTFNQYVEDYLFRPIAYTYNALMPQIGRDAVSNLLDNLSSPVVLANDILQLEPGRAWETTQRMAINTTLGIGGLWDAAAWMGIEEHREDFGQTLAVWGVGEMFYLVLPVLGPTNPRDAVGKYLVDGYFDPLGYYLANTDRDDYAWSRTGVSALSDYAGVVSELDEIRATSIDYYAALRSYVRQNREKDIRNGRPLSGEALDRQLDYDLDLD